MKAYTQKVYGAPEVLTLEDTEKPIPGEKEVLVKVHALSVNPAEWHKLTGSVWLVRLSEGLMKPKNKILGADIAGTAEVVGKGVTGFRVGDRILGRCFTGGLAEYCCLEEGKSAKIPAGIGFEEAATIPLAAVTALTALRDKGHIKPGQSVLINGAAGGIGTYAIQLAKYFNTTVTGICSSDKQDFVKLTGADKITDYTKTDFTQMDGRYDLILDLAGNRRVQDLLRVLKSNGICVLIGMKLPGILLTNIFTGSLISAFSGKKVLSMNTQVKAEDLNYVLNLFSQNKLHAVIERTFDFESVREAFEHIGKGRTRGKVVIKVKE